ncbi:hypothetical protein [Pseudomonas entomophila]|uniref:Lipoprotein n=2 Tax=Pseudomonas entomophila TaxID=312306 RepID=Q1IAM5_PSEE4|nr:hypothetical protein [Pseudomonas entomophila]WMW03937.1 hypothetical protein RAH46_16535 [Pseudomonas entomophila]CAK15292.1 hypothetical protein PSEEN2487 [Pseudomonas entomophila L48]
MNRNILPRPLSTCFVGLTWAFAVIACVAAEPGPLDPQDQALQARMAVCQGRINQFEQLMIDHIEGTELRFGDQLRRRPELEQLIRVAQAELDQERAYYDDLPYRPEHQLYLRGLESNIDNLRRSLAVALEAERRIETIKPFLAQARTRGQGNRTLLDDFDFALQDCATGAVEQADCQAQTLQPLRKPLADALNASFYLLYEAVPPLGFENVRYPSAWEDDCRSPAI